MPTYRDVAEVEQIQYATLYDVGILEEMLVPTLVRYLQFCIARKSCYPFKNFRPFAEFVGGYRYLTPTSRVICSDLVKTLLDCDIPFREISYISYTLEHYTNDQQYAASTQLRIKYLNY